MSSIKGTQELSRADQQKINGGNEQCRYAISIDGTLCLCAGWYPDGSGYCAPV